MIDRIREYIFKLFEGVPQTSRVNEAKEELLAGCIDKYNDLVNEGKNEEEAYSEVIAGIGDVNELLSTIVDNNQNYTQKNTQEKTHNSRNYYDSPKSHENISDIDIINLKNKRNKFITISIVLFILGFLIALVRKDSAYNYVRTNLSIMFLCWIIAAFILFYGIISTKIVNDVNGWVSNKNAQKEIPYKSLRGPITSTMWLVTVVIYLLISFITYDWYITWLIFILAVVVQMFINYTFSKAKFKRGHVISILWTSCVFIYLFISMVTYSWYITWIIFPITVCIQQAVILYFAWRK